MTGTAGQGHGSSAWKTESGFLGTKVNPSGLLVVAGVREGMGWFKVVRNDKLPAVSRRPTWLSWSLFLNFALQIVQVINL